jgi:hypothetical protein
MAASAAKENANISSEAMEAYLDRFMGMEAEAQSIMGKAMKECKDGPRKDQRDLKSEMKDAGVRLKAFGALLAVRKAQEKMADAASGLEDDDLDQYRKIAQNFDKDTIFGYMARKALDEAEFE